MKWRIGRTAAFHANRRFSSKELCLLPSPKKPRIIIKPEPVGLAEKRPRLVSTTARSRE